MGPPPPWTSLWGYHGDPVNRANLANSGHPNKGAQPR